MQLSAVAERRAHMQKYILALDQGTTSSRCILFDKAGTICSMSQKEFTQIYPKPGWVEHNPKEIWSSQLSVATECMAMAGAGRRADSSHRHHQPKRDYNSMGQRYRGACLQCHCMAVPPDLGHD